MSGTGRTRRATGPTYSRPTSWPSAGCVISIQPSGKPSDPLGWRFQAAIHGLATSSGRPDTSNDLWCNCQHGSWYFLPWHRMYLAAFERIVRHTLEDETWALPYWYSIDPDDPGKAAVPPAFLDMTLNDNNLETSERSQTARSGLPFYGDIDPVQVGETVIATLSLRPLRDTERAGDVRRWRTRRPELRRRRAGIARERAPRRRALAGRQRLRRGRQRRRTRAGWARSTPPAWTRCSGCTTPTSTGCGRSGSSSTRRT